MTKKYCYSIGEQGQESLGILEKIFRDIGDLVQLSEDARDTLLNNKLVH